MSVVFADTFYFLALLNKLDAAHEKAVLWSSALERLVTTEWVLTELADGLASSRNRSIFHQTRQELLANQDSRVVPLDMTLYEEGLSLYANRRDKAWSLTDCISFVVMRREAIKEALTEDHHFEQAGFVALLK
jgi:hypothetical protein